MAGIATGTLLLADIGGYTRYLGSVELEHSHDVLGDLIGVVASGLAPVLRVEKLEGDAVFCSDPGDRLDAATIVTAITSTYVAFARRRRTIAHATTCPCDACRRIPELDLKFVAHHGSFVEHDIAGSRELTGSDVITVHRLLKNAIDTPAYALLTDALVNRYRIDAPSLGLRTHLESYDEVGEVPAKILDLDAAWRAECEREPVVVTAEAAALRFEAEVPAEQEIVWATLTDPHEQIRWRPGVTRVDEENPRIARGVGSRAHCVHGDTAIDQEIVDWRPPELFTYRERNPLGICTWTVELERTGDATTRFVWRMRLEEGRRQRIVFRALRGRVERDLRSSFDAAVEHARSVQLERRDHQEVP